MEYQDAAYVEFVEGRDSDSRTQVETLVMVYKVQLIQGLSILL